MAKEQSKPKQTDPPKCKRCAELELALTEAYDEIDRLQSAPAAEPDLVLPTEVKEIRKHGLPPQANVESIAATCGLDLETCLARLEAAAKENPCVKRATNEGVMWEIYGLDLQRYLGFSFKPLRAG